MKSEERIIELLADYLKKADQLLDRMDRTERGIEIMSKAIAEDSVKFNKVFGEIKQLREDQNRMREEQGIMLKELVSLSKRVAVVEEKH